MQGIFAYEVLFFPDANALVDKLKAVQKLRHAATTFFGKLIPNFTPPFPNALIYFITIS